MPIVKLFVEGDGCMSLIKGILDSMRVKVKGIDCDLVEKSLKAIPDYFKLIVLAAYRGQELAAGATPSVPIEGNKGAVVALREVASGNLDLEALEHRVVANLQQFSFLDNKEDL